MTRRLVHQGSTKDVYAEGENYVFHFSDRYSVFDWGEMPDSIPGKGAALAQFTLSLYEELEAAGIKTHLVKRSGAVDEMTITPFEVIRGTMPAKENVFIPLEVIFRTGVPLGSSLLKRFPGEYEEGQRFPKPMVEFTTKLERFDRPLTHGEAKALSGLSETEWNNLVTTTRKIALKLQEIFEHSGIELWDGKVEFAAGARFKGQREIVLVDTIGPDELRLTKSGVALSKEYIRQYYRKFTWYNDLELVKEKFGEEFKEHIDAPPKLRDSFLSAVKEMYELLPVIIKDPSKTPELDLLIAKLKGELS